MRTTDRSSSPFTASLLQQAPVKGATVETFLSRTHDHRVELTAPYPQEAGGEEILATHRRLRQLAAEARDLAPQGKPLTLGGLSWAIEQHAAAEVGQGEALDQEGQAIRARPWTERFQESTRATLSAVASGCAFAVASAAIFAAGIGGLVAVHQPELLTALASNLPLAQKIAPLVIGPPVLATLAISLPHWVGTFVHGMSNREATGKEHQAQELREQAGAERALAQTFDAWRVHLEAPAIAGSVLDPWRPSPDPAGRTT